MIIILLGHCYNQSYLMGLLYCTFVWKFFLVVHFYDYFALSRIFSIFFSFSIYSITFLTIVFWRFVFFIPFLIFYFLRMLSHLLLVCHSSFKVIHHCIYFDAFTRLFFYIYTIATTLIHPQIHLVWAIWCSFVRNFAYLSIVVQHLFNTCFTCELI